MIGEKKIIAIIPARGGSKRLPRKNILDLGGKPLISWTIEAAQNSKYIDKVILSSDDLEICEIAREFHCEVPFIRPSDLAQDSTDSASVIVHAINNCGSLFNTIVLLQPTSPFRTSEHIDQALEDFYRIDALSLTSVTLLNKSPQWLYTLDSKENKMCRLLSEDNDQNTSTAYMLNGAIYVVDKKHFINNKTFIDKNTVAYIMNLYSSLDIDTEEDFNQAKFILSHGLLK